MAYEPDFTSDVTGEVTRLSPVRFTYIGSTSPAPASYIWDFGDGLISNEEFPIVTWRTNGNKTVKLTVIYDDDVQAVEEKVDYITIIEGILPIYLGYLLQQYKNKTTIKNLLSPFIDQATILDFICGKLSSIWSLSGYGVQLDAIGEILGLPRLGRTDAEYRELLLWMPYINHGYGQINIFIQYSDLFLNAYYVTILDLPGVIYVDAIIEGEYNYNLFLQRLQMLAASGVQVRLVISDNAEIPIEFEYTDEPPIYETANELSEIDYENNGYLAELY